MGGGGSPHRPAASKRCGVHFLGGSRSYNKFLVAETNVHGMTNRRVILFVDNDAAAACLVRGYSPKSDSSAIVGTFWLLASQTKSEIYIDRVESKSNIADGPSRLDFSVLEAMHATAVSPNTSPLFISDLSWFVGSHTSLKLNSS